MRRPDLERGGEGGCRGLRRGVRGGLRDIRLVACAHSSLRPFQVRGKELAERIYFAQNSEGGGLSPYDCWLCLRGLKTMSLRMERQQARELSPPYLSLDPPSLPPSIHPSIINPLPIKAAPARAQENCAAMADWLHAHPLVTKINYPGHPSDPGYALQMRQVFT